MSPEVVISRAGLLRPDATDGGDDDGAATARRIVAESTLMLSLAVDDPTGSRRIDGWVGPDGVLWHAGGDTDARHPALVTPGAHLPSMICHLVDLGPRRNGTGREVVVPRAGLWDTTELTAARAWTLTWWHHHEPQHGMTVVDEGPTGRVWAVAAATVDSLRLRAVRPLDVWTRLAELVSKSAGDDVGDVTEE